MSFTDKVKHKAEELRGKAKQTTGEATGDEELAAEGHDDQVRGKTKQVGDKVKDTVSDIGKALGPKKDKR